MFQQSATQQHNSAEPTATGKNGCYANGCSAFLCFVGGLLLIVGSCIPQRRYTDKSGFFNRNVDLYFYQQKSSQFGGTTYTADIPDCIKPAYSAGMAMGIIGGAAALLGGVPLTYCATKLMTSPLRFVRPFVIVVGASLGLIATIISALTTKCNGFDFASNYKLFVGFGFLIAGDVLLFLSALIGVLQASKCPDASRVAPPMDGHPGLHTPHPQGAFASNQGNTISTAGAYSFATGQHQQQGYQQYQPQGGQFQQQQHHGVPMMGVAIASYQQQQQIPNHTVSYGGGTTVYSGSPAYGGAPAYGNTNSGGGIY